MKWINHVVIAGSVAAVWKPELVPLTILGSTAPDWLEWLAKAVGRRVRHRTVTHYVVYWLFGVLFGLFIWDFHHALTAFCLGGLFHVLCDALTVQGVPLGWWSDRRFHLFGGRLRTGQMGEYWVSGAIVIACFCLSIYTKGWNGAAQHTPFFYNYAGYYQAGLIDGHEWKQNRFRWL